LNETFTLLTASGGIAGAFDQLELPTLEDGLWWHVQYAANEVRAMVDDVMPGDFNRDGNVDAADYVAWAKNGGHQSGFNYWRANFGSSIGGGSASLANAPEPAAAWMLLCAMTVGALLRARTAC
jgi:hypothetical protein